MHSICTPNIDCCKYQHKCIMYRRQQCQSVRVRPFLIRMYGTQSFSKQQILIFCQIWHHCSPYSAEVQICIILEGFYIRCTGSKQISIGLKKLLQKVLYTSSSTKEGAEEEQLLKGHISYTEEVSARAYAQIFFQHVTRA